MLWARRESCGQTNKTHERICLRVRHLLIYYPRAKWPELPLWSERQGHALSFRLAGARARQRQDKWTRRAADGPADVVVNCAALLLEAPDRRRLIGAPRTDPPTEREEKEAPAVPACQAVALSRPGPALPDTYRRPFVPRPQCAIVAAGDNDDGDDCETAPPNLRQAPSAGRACLGEI